MERVATIIVGGGQAGLATSYYLRQEGHEHIVLEQAPAPAPVWRNERWDSFTLVTPNWALRLPGAEYDGPDREAYLSRAEIIDYFDRYVARFRLPVQCNTRVEAVEPLDGRGFRVATERRAYRADNVVIATGYDQQPKIPAAAGLLSPAITQLHSSRYRNPDSLPPGAVLVVGTAQSGSQIAEELYEHGRTVYLSVGNAGRAPRRYRGKDIFEWLYQVGFFDLPPEKLPVPREKFAAPHVSGTKGGHTLNLHQFARDGVTLLGHVRGASGNTIVLAGDLHQTLARVDGFEQEAQKMIDGYIQANGIDAPTEELPRLRDGYGQIEVETLDLDTAGVRTVIWATGFTHDYGLVKLPIVDETGFPIQQRGVTRYPGLYFVGMPWMPALRSGILAGVGAFAADIASRIIDTARVTPVSA